LASGYGGSELDDAVLRCFSSVQILKDKFAYDRAAIAQRWLPPAESGDALAQYCVGMALGGIEPYEVTDLNDQALQWLTKAADQHFVPDSIAAAGIYGYGERGAAANYADGVWLFTGKDPVDSLEARKRIGLALTIASHEGADENFKDLGAASMLQRVSALLREADR
jgi:hypothetical protein